MNDIVKAKNGNHFQNYKKENKDIGLKNHKARNYGKNRHGYGLQEKYYIFFLQPSFTDS